MHILIPGLHHRHVVLQVAQAEELYKLRIPDRPHIIPSLRPVLIADPQPAEHRLTISPLLRGVLQHLPAEVRVQLILPREAIHRAVPIIEVQVAVQEVLRGQAVQEVIRALAAVPVLAVLRDRAVRVVTHVQAVVPVRAALRDRVVPVPQVREVQEVQAAHPVLRVLDDNLTII